MTYFGETVEIAIALTKYNGIRLELEYTVSNGDTGEVRAVGTSKHCFLTETAESFPEAEQSRVSQDAGRI